MVERTHTSPLKSTERYNSVAIILHWLIASGVLALIVIGLAMDHFVDDPSPFYPLHQSLGVTVMVLVVLRIIWRLTHRAPSLPDDISVMGRIAAHSVAGILYFFQVIVPVSGWLMVSAMGAPVVWFSVFEWPNIPLSESILSSATFAGTVQNAHHWLAWVFSVVIVLHASAALYHRFVKRDQILSRMMPYVTGSQSKR